jgi:hypothetical protein
MNERKALAVVLYAQIAHIGWLEIRRSREGNPERTTLDSRIRGNDGLLRGNDETTFAGMTKLLSRE